MKHSRVGCRCCGSCCLWRTVLSNGFSELVRVQEPLMAWENIGRQEEGGGRARRGTGRVGCRADGWSYQSRSGVSLSPLNARMMLLQQQRHTPSQTLISSHDSEWDDSREFENLRKETEAPLSLAPSDRVGDERVIQF